MKKKDNGSSQMTFGGDEAPKKSMQEPLPPKEHNYATQWAYGQYSIQQHIRGLPVVSYEKYLAGER